MKMRLNGDVMTVYDLHLLTAETCEPFRQQVLASLGEECRALEVDLEQIEFMDSYGLAALISVRNFARGRNVRLRIVKPSRQACFLLKFTRMGHAFEVLNDEPLALAA